MARFSPKHAIYRVFTRQYGLTLKADASRYLEEVLQRPGLVDGPDDRRGNPYGEVSSFLLQIAEALLKQKDACSDVVTRLDLEPIVRSLQLAAEAAQRKQADNGKGALGVDVTQNFHVINAFDVPSWDYAADQRTFVQAKRRPGVCAPADAKANLFRSRFHLLRQRLARNEMFCPAFAGATDDDYLKITTVQSMLGCEGEEFLLFGMLTQIREGSYYLEDLDSYVELDISECVFTTGIFTENCFVLAEGMYTADGIFKTRTLGLPPPERRDLTTSLFGNINFFGSPTSIIEERILKRAEEEDFVNECFVILSDVWLDQPKTLSKLKVIFEGFAKTAVPLAFLLCGNFISEPYLFNGKEAAKYREAFETLADIITDVPELSESLFVFVPGANDPWAGEILPRPPLPEFFISKFKTRVPHAVFATNPCRIKFCTQEIVIFREDLLAKLRRNAIHVVNNHDAAARDGAPMDDLKRHLVRTVCDQAHLCPMLLSVRPAYWAYDHALRLYPLPHTLILADSHDRYIFNYEDCHCINPGSFSTSEYKFLVYYPGRKTTQPSEVPVS